MRGFLVRRRVKRMTRGLVDSLHREMVADQETAGGPASHYNLGVYLLRCYEAGRDQAVFAWYSQVLQYCMLRHSVLTVLTQMLVKKRQELLNLIATDTQWLFLVSRIINLALGENCQDLRS